MAKADFQPIGITKVIDKPSPMLTNPGVGPDPIPTIPGNPIFEGGTGGAVVDHLFNTDTIGLLGVSPALDHLG
jgi:hypothetical protein